MHNTVQLYYELCGTKGLYHFSNMRTLTVELIEPLPLEVHKCATTIIESVLK